MGLTNNDILKKLRVALKMRDDDIVKVLSLVDFKISKSELGAFFRSEDHPKYMDCQDQILRNFLNFVDQFLIKSSLNILVLGIFIFIFTKLELETTIPRNIQNKTLYSINNSIIKHFMVLVSTTKTL